jgi:transposase InsO family protein
VQAISVDNGAEFMADFEAACQARGIALFNLPLRSPKLHGSVERANRTHTEELYEVTDAPAELDALQTGLADWELCSNTIRPNQALGYLTPLNTWPRSGSRCHERQRNASRVAPTDASRLAGVQTSKLVRRDGCRG